MKSGFIISKKSFGFKKAGQQKTSRFRLAGWSGEVLFDQGLEGGLALHADQAVDFLAVLEEDERGDAHHAQRDGGVGVFVDVELAEGHAARVLLGQRFEHGRGHAAGAAPGSPEVDQRKTVQVLGFQVFGSKLLHFQSSCQIH